MALTAGELAYLRMADQRFRARIAIFDAYEPTTTYTQAADGTGTGLAPTPIVMCSPRYQIAAHDETVNLLGTNSYNRGGTYVGDANISFALKDGDAGEVTDNADGTATYTAPSEGTATATIEITVTNENGSKTGYAFVQYPKDTYDNIIGEIASISASFDNHGYKMLLRAKGETSAFAIGKGVLLHVEDSWAGTLSTFGGYEYPEGVFYGYITGMQYYEDYSGEYWLGMSVESPWWLLKRKIMGETFWGSSGGGNKFWLPDFRPVDTIWYFVNEILDFTLYHDCVLWYDSNTIDDLIIDESDLATIIADVMERTLSIAYCDRYGSLFCVPDPDVRADEYWGTPTATFALTENYCKSYDIEFRPYECSKLTLWAVDASKRGIYAISENPTALGSRKEVGTLICDKSLTLASWAVQKRAQLNRAWIVNAELPLNHTVDINNFLDVNLTNPTQVSGKTASGSAWIAAINYRPNLVNGQWAGRWQLRKRTEGDGEAETGSVSSWGGSGDYNTGQPETSGSGSCDWSAESGGSGTAAWCYRFDFKNSGSGGWAVWSDWVVEADLPFTSGTPGLYAADTGWQTQECVRDDTGTGTPTQTAHFIQLERIFPVSTITYWRVFFDVKEIAGGTEKAELYKGYNTGWSSLTSTALEVGTQALTWTGVLTAANLLIRMRLGNVGITTASIVLSATIQGSGTNPFATADNC